MMKNNHDSDITTPEKMTIVKSGNRLDFYTGQVEIKETLDPGEIYQFNSDATFGTMWLSPLSPLTLPIKIYDFEKDFRKQVLVSLRSLESNMNIGVLLEGYKGQGKSVVAKQIAIESNLPVIVINQEIPKICDFTGYLSGITQDYVLLIDEFEKLFKEFSSNGENKREYHTQDSFLSFLDGANGLNHKRLVIFTSNKEIGDKFINRPSRIRYYKRFNFMNKEVFKAILDDKLEDQSFRKDLEDNLDIPSCTIDLLTSIVNEINIHNRPYTEFKEFFNHKDREITYTRYRKSKDGRFEFYDDVKAKREVGLEDEYIKNLFGYNAKVISNDGETIFYEEKEYEYDDNDNLKTTNKVIYKVIKNKWQKPNLIF